MTATEVQLNQAMPWQPTPVLFLFDYLGHHGLCFNINSFLFNMCQQATWRFYLLTDRRIASIMIYGFLFHESIKLHVIFDSLFRTPDSHLSWCAQVRLQGDAHLWQASVAWVFEVTAEFFKGSEPSWKHNIRQENRIWRLINSYNCILCTI